MAACKLASQGKTMADSSYDMEVQTLMTLLKRQTPADVPVTPIQVDIKNPEDYVAPRFYKKLKGKQVSGVSLSEILRNEVSGFTFKIN